MVVRDGKRRVGIGDLRRGCPHIEEIGLCTRIRCIRCVVPRHKGFVPENSHLVFSRLGCYVCGMRVVALFAGVLLLSSCVGAQKKPVTEQEMLAALWRNPQTRPLAIDYIRQKHGLPPGPDYQGNCPTDYHYDAIGSRCGKRSAWARPGGY